MIGECVLNMRMQQTSFNNVLGLIQVRFDFGLSVIIISAQTFQYWCGVLNFGWDSFVMTHTFFNFV
jgi:hypothetical protein